MAYQEWLKRYHGELLARTGLNPEDGPSDDCLKSFYKEKASPVEVVDWLIRNGSIRVLKPNAFFSTKDTLLASRVFEETPHQFQFDNNL